MMSSEAKALKKRERMLAKAAEYQTGTYSSKFVAPLFQQVVRAEAAALPAGQTYAMVQCQYEPVFREVGQCVCITCGTVGPWKGNFFGGGVIESGHFIASRRASILYEETNVNPQCKVCNQHLHGNHGVYEGWMRNAYGQEEIDRLQRLKNQVISFTREQLVDKRIAYKIRLDAAVSRMQDCG